MVVDDDLPPRSFSERADAFLEALPTFAVEALARTAHDRSGVPQLPLLLRKLLRKS